MTPEGRVKKMVTSYLQDLQESLTDPVTLACPLFYSMFVPTGYGRRNSLDYTICFYGQHVAIETKAPGEDLTPNQRITCRDLYHSGAKVFIISGADGMAAFRKWAIKYASSPPPR